MVWALLLGFLFMMAPAFAQQHPFAVGGQEALGSNNGLTGLILAWQNKFNSEGKLQKLGDDDKNGL